MMDANLPRPRAAELVEALRKRVPIAPDANRLPLVIFIDRSLSMALTDGNVPPDDTTPGSAKTGERGGSRPASEACSD
jgi:hypothetical protein